MSSDDEAAILPIVQYLVDEMGADLTLRSDVDDTAAEICQRQGKQQLYQLLARKENEEALKRAATASAKTRLAEQVQAAGAAAQALVNELAAEEAAEEARKQAKKAKEVKAKAKSKRAQAMTGGKGEQGGNGGGSAAGGGGGGDAAARPCVASLTAATGRLAMGNEEEEDHVQGVKREEGSPVDGKPPALVANDTLPPSLSAAQDDKDRDQEEEDDEEAFQDYLLDKVPLEYHCPIGICLLTDPINAADGHTYQRAELENWIEMCRVKQQPLTSPMTKEEMVPMYFPNHYVKSQVGGFIEQQRQEWVAMKGKKKGGRK